MPYNYDNNELVPTNWFKPWQPYDVFCEEEGVVLFHSREMIRVDVKLRQEKGTINKWGDACHDIERSIRELAFTVAANIPDTVDNLEMQRTFEKHLYHKIKDIADEFVDKPIETVDWDTGQE
jgi:hypothetical protein|tara:strand:- start:3564 stop:3929 length:366 start_codon:yes stop_codon:yes gene_type:complete